MSEMNSVDPRLEAVFTALSKVIDPEIRRPITDLGMVGDINIDDDFNVAVQIFLTIAGCPMSNSIRSDVENQVSAVEGVKSVSVSMQAMSEQQRNELKEKLRGSAPEAVIPFAQPGNMTRVIAIASGKGGVGKSSITVNLAMALSTLGKQVGILDADIYGHSIPDMLGLGDARPTGVENMIMPVPFMGMKVISIGMLKESRDQVVAWRGPVLDRALTQLLSDVYWGDLDYLLIDMPPGTGDIAMSLGNKVPNSEVIVVTTPQTAAVGVAERAGTMAGMLEQKVIGVIENMSYYEATCPHCDKTHKVDLFGSGGGQELSEVLSDRLGYDVPLLAQIPLDQTLRTHGDDGMPVVVSDVEQPSAKAINALAKEIAAKKRDLLGMKLGLTPVNNAGASGGGCGGGNCGC